MLGLPTSNDVGKNTSIHFGIKNIRPNTSHNLEENESDGLPFIREIEKRRSFNKGYQYQHGVEETLYKITL